MTREEAIKKLQQHKAEYLDEWVDFSGITEALDMAIKALEQEPKTGCWIKTVSENGVTSAVRCSECGFEDNRYTLYRFCPNCGADMRGKE